MESTLSTGKATKLRGAHHDRDRNNPKRLATETALPVASPASNGGTASGTTPAVVGKVTPVRYDGKTRRGRKRKCGPLRTFLIAEQVFEWRDGSSKQERRGATRTRRVKRRRASRSAGAKRAHGAGAGVASSLQYRYYYDQQPGKSAANTGQKTRSVVVVAP